MQGTAERAGCNEQQNLPRHAHTKASTTSSLPSRPAMATFPSESSRPKASTFDPPAQCKPAGALGRAGAERRAYLFGRALLNGDEPAVVELRVNGGGGRRHKEGHVVVMRSHRVAEGANLVGCAGKEPRVRRRRREAGRARREGLQVVLKRRGVQASRHRQRARSWHAAWLAACAGVAVWLRSGLAAAARPPVSPLAAMRSAPTTTASTLPAAMRAAAAESQIRVEGRPSCTSSYAVRRAPCT